MRIVFSIVVTGALAALALAGTASADHLDDAQASHTCNKAVFDANGGACPTGGNQALLSGPDQPAPADSPTDGQWELDHDTVTMGCSAMAAVDDPDAAAANNRKASFTVTAVSEDTDLAATELVYIASELPAGIGEAGGLEQVGTAPVATCEVVWVGGPFGVALPEWNDGTLWSSS